MAHKERGERRPRPKQSVRLGDRGRLVLPAAIRKRLKLSKGDRVIIAVEPDGRVTLRSLREEVGKLQGILREYRTEKSETDAFIRDRREEARREERG